MSTLPGRKQRPLFIHSIIHSHLALCKSPPLSLSNPLLMEWPATYPPSDFLCHRLRILSCVFTRTGHMASLNRAAELSMQRIQARKEKPPLGHQQWCPESSHMSLLAPEPDGLPASNTQHPHKNLPLIPQDLALTNLTRDRVSSRQRKPMERWMVLHDLWDPERTQQTR